MSTVTNSATDSRPRSFREKLAWYCQREWLRLMVLIACGVIARFPALGGQLIWDDDYLVKDNPFIKSPLLILESFRHYLFLDSFSTHYRPVQNISYCVDYLIWGGDPAGYHISNVLWHLAASILIYFLLRRILPKLGQSLGTPAAWSAVAFLVALVWDIHPAHSAAIDYISGRADSLAFVFACGGWLLYLKARQTKNLLWQASAYSAAAGLSLLALSSRESGFMWLAIFLFYLWTFDGARFRTKFIACAVVLMVIAAYAGLRHLPQSHIIETPPSDTPAPMRAVLILRALGDYGRVLVWPAALHMDRSVEAPASLLGNEGWRFAIRAEYLSLLGLALAAALIYGAVRAGRARSVRAFGAGWFVIAFLPVSNLIPLNATVAEHWLYLPSVGLLIFACGWVMEFPIRTRRIFWATASVAVIALSARSVVRSNDWSSPETFYRHALASGAAKPRMALNLSLALAEKKDYKSAEPLLRRVVAICPDYPIAANALAHVLFRQGKTEEANRYFALASEIAERTRNEYPRTWIAALNLAHMRFRDHDLQGALKIVEDARLNYPGTWELISYQSELLRRMQGPTAALPLVEEFRRANWWHANAAIAAGKLYSELGRYSEAEAAFRLASRLDIKGVEALNLIALQDVRCDKLSAALAVQQQALSRQPDQPRQHLLLSDILERMGRGNEARDALAHASQLREEVQSETLAN
jgi:tetratricopeptide (TPR) repeat protein